MDTNPSTTLKFVNSHNSPKNFHFKLDFRLDLFFGIQLLLLLGPPLHLQQQGGGGEAIGTYGMAVGVLGAEIQLQPFGGVRIDLSARPGTLSVSIAPAQPISSGLWHQPRPSHRLRGRNRRHTRTGSAPGGRAAAPALAGTSRLLSRGQQPCRRAASPQSHA